MNSQKKTLRQKLHEIVYEADSSTGKVFDILLLVAILLSVLVVMLESVESINLKYGSFLFFIEWFFTILFTFEYIIRIWVLKRPANYIFSFFGIVDLLSILPTYLSLFFTGTHYLLVIRSLRLLRIFRIFKLTRYLSESKILLKALKASRTKITIFIFTVLMMVCIIGSIMYLVEGPENGFNSIPESVYWVIVTITTVGYGDITPQTNLGKLLSAIIMIMGYGILAVPTGIVASELNTVNKVQTNTQSCSNCGNESHDDDAEFCKICGESLGR